MDGGLADVRALISLEPQADGEADGTISWLRRLCSAAAHSLPASGAGVSVMGETTSRGVAAASDLASQQLEEMQFSLGEGPCMDAFALRQPVLAPDLKDSDSARWPVYSPAAYEKGVHAVFAFPLQVGAARLGVLDVYRAQKGSLSREALAQALSFAEVAVQTLLDGQATAENGLVNEGLDRILDYRSELYQAQGMVMVQLGVGLEDAIVRLRAHAFANDRALGDVARDIVMRKLTLDRDAP